MYIKHKQIIIKPHSPKKLNKKNEKKNFKNGVPPSLCGTLR